MAPNIIVKAAFVRGDYDSSKVINGCYEISCNAIRTDFVLQNMYAYLIGSSANFQRVPAVNEKEEHLIGELKKIADSFKEAHLRKLQELLCHEELYTKETISAFLSGISNELFCEGITWSRIVALFVFVSELTLVSIGKNLSDNITDIIYESFCRFVKENLSGWVEDHGGWEGMLSLSEEQRLDGTPSNKGWAKSILHGTVRMLGTIAHIANSSAQVFP